MNEAREIARPYVQRVNTQVEYFIHLVTGKHSHPDEDMWEKMPPDFSITSEKWRAIESQIEDAIAAGNEKLVDALCYEYERRAMKYLASWRERLSQ